MMKVKKVKHILLLLIFVHLLLLEFTLTAVDFGQLPLPFTPTWNLRWKLRSSGYSNYPTVIESAADCLLANCRSFCAFFCPFFFIFFFSLPLSLSLSLSEEEENSIVHIFQIAIDFSYCVFQIVTHPLLLSLFSLRRKLIANSSICNFILFAVYISNCNSPSSSSFLSLPSLLSQIQRKLNCKLKLQFAIDFFLLCVFKL